MGIWSCPDIYMESRESEAFWFILGAICLEIYSVPFGLIKINRVYLLVQVLINLHGYFYVALQLKIQRRRWTDDRAKRVWWVCADDSHFAFLKRLCNWTVDLFVVACAKCEDTSSWSLLCKSWLRHFQYFALQNSVPTCMRHTAATNVQTKDRKRTPHPSASPPPSPIGKAILYVVHRWYF